MVTVYINDVPVQVEEGTTIMEAAKKAGFEIPHLCHFEGLEPFGACRLCLVEVEGMPKPVISCATRVSENMRVHTDTPRIRRDRKVILELILASHPMECQRCEASLDCELLKLANLLGIRDSRFPYERSSYGRDSTSVALERDPNKCILCGRCVRACDEIQSVGAIAFLDRGPKTHVGTFMDLGLGHTNCVNCGQCLQVCPVGAIVPRDVVDAVWDAIQDPDKFVVVQEAPAVRVALGEEFGMPPGTLVTGKMYEALRRLGFDAVLDTNFGADLTIVEEATELLHRVDGREQKPLPQFTSCCPGWIKFVEHEYPELIPHLSTCKSPHEMVGALAKTFYAQRLGISADKVVVVSVMPCTAKKFEASREELAASGYPDVDYVLTTRELARMIKEAGIDFARLPEGKADDIMGHYTGAATIFGATGGVMEAALRSFYYFATGNELAELDITPVRGFEGVKEAQIQVNGLTVKAAVAHGLANARKLMEAVKAGKAEYHFIEVMACPGGCVGGGGQPGEFSWEKRKQRASGLYSEDSTSSIRVSHRNPWVQRLYDNYLGEPLSELSEKLLHTHYKERPL
ncbi:4Fe-4S dicluster domain-containing protein [Coprothermobacteraceae bacterium]|nr:4Fe-4S dicluster domain-containing protein [Coprothermobacteraceae bacterium]